MQTETQPTKKRRWPKAVLALAALVYLGFRALEFCGITGPSVSGVVTDAETGEPIEGAFVAATSLGVINMIVHSQSTCDWVESAVTDKNGKYRIPRWWSLQSWIPLFERRVDVMTYKSGYHYGDNPRIDTFDVTMKKNTAPYPERFAELKQLALRASCDGARNTEKSLYPFFKAMTEDAAKYATTDEERKAMHWFQEIAAGKLVETYRDMTGTEYREQLKAIMEKGLP